ncbi:hypothetical protein [Phenylobacterium sp.]|uniref:hypothetical protein n=1 Tax=Phenylobacterium sp. TaxID=1871053 RepID=UPI0027310BAC|nr:hypothetical protein [Phenylobacterium sp.]MDP1598712.1 hypothetical protein [Phenylobacterium sp.]
MFTFPQFTQHHLAFGRLSFSPQAQAVTTEAVCIFEAFPREMFEDFREQFGVEAFYDHLVGSKICIPTDTLRPKSHEARDFLEYECRDFFLEYAVFIGEPPLI